jgi:CheY-like chemotaxis protein
MPSTPTKKSACVNSFKKLQNYIEAMNPFQSIIPDTEAITYRILVAEDDRQSQQWITELLSGYPNPKFSVMCVPNGKIACELAASQMPDIILMDWEMPVMNGLEALEIIKSNTTTAHIPIIMVTALSLPEDLDLALSAGADDYLTKPYEKLQLIARIKAVMKRAQVLKSLREEISRLKGGQ